MNTIIQFAAVSGRGFIDAIIDLVILAVIFGVLLFIVIKSPIPEPFKKVIIWLIYFAAAIFLINWLLAFRGQSFIQFN